MKWWKKIPRGARAGIAFGVVLLWGWVVVRRWNEAIAINQGLYWIGFVLSVALLLCAIILFLEEMLPIAHDHYEESE